MKMEPQEPAPVKLQAIVILVFVACNMGLNYFNSWALRGGRWPGFQFPLFYTIWHMLVSAIASMVLMLTVVPPAGGLPTFRKFWEQRYALGTIGLCTVLNVGLNNWSLTLVSLFVNQVIKATAPLPTTALSYFIAKKTYTWQVVLSCAALVAGSILANAHSMTAVNPEERTSVVGVVLCLISLACNALKPVISMVMMAGTGDQAKLEPMTLLFYDSCIAMLLLIIFWLADAPERAASVAYMGREPGTAIGIIAAGATMAFCFNISVYYFVKFTSALTSTVGSNGVKIIIIIISAIQAHEYSATSWVGITMVVLSIVAYW